MEGVVLSTARGVHYASVRTYAFDRYGRVTLDVMVQTTGSVDSLKIKKIDLLHVHRAPNMRISACMRLAPTFVVTCD